MRSRGCRHNIIIHCSYPRRRHSSRRCCRIVVAVTCIEIILGQFTSAQLQPNNIICSLQIFTAFEIHYIYSTVLWYRWVLHIIVCCPLDYVIIVTELLSILLYTYWLLLVCANLCRRRPPILYYYYWLVVHYISYNSVCNICIFLYIFGLLLLTFISPYSNISIPARVVLTDLPHLVRVTPAPTKK